MWPAMLIAIYCVCLIFASLAGGWLPSLMRLTHTRMQLMMSFVGGLMLGVAILHLLPHAVVQTGSLRLRGLVVHTRPADDVPDHPRVQRPPARPGARPGGR